MLLQNTLEMILETLRFSLTLKIQQKLKLLVCSKQHSQQHRTKSNLGTNHSFTKANQRQRAAGKTLFQSNTCCQLTVGKFLRDMFTLLGNCSGHCLKKTKNFTPKINSNAVGICYSNNGTKIIQNLIVFVNCVIS